MPIHGDTPKHICKFDQTFQASVLFSTHVGNNQVNIIIIFNGAFFFSFVCFQIVEWESGVDKVLEVKDKPLMGVCDWGNPVDITDISSESSVRLFQGVHDIGELSPSRRRDRAREQSIERLDQSIERRNQSIERQNPSTDRQKRSTERRRRSIERRKRSKDRRKQSLEGISQGKDGKGKKVKRVKSKTKVPEDSTDKLRNVRSQNHSEAKIKMSSAKDVKAMAGACQLSPTDSTVENRFMIPEAPVKVKHSNGLKDFFLRKLRSQASKSRTHGKVLGKAIHADKETSENCSGKDSLSGSSKEVEHMDESDINTRKSGATNPNNVHSTRQTAKHTELGKHLLNSILSDENLAEETLELESSEQNDKRNIDRTDVYSYVSLGFATDCITALDRQGDPSENTALIEMNMKDYDLVNSVSDSLIASDKVTHTPVKTKSEDSLYGYTLAARQTDVNAMERRKETDKKIRVETDVHEGPQIIATGNVKSVKDAKNIFETEHSAESLPSKKNGRKPMKLNDAKDHILAEKENKGVKHNESSREGSASDTAVQKEHLCKNDTSENGPKDDSPMIKNSEQTHCRESLQEKLLPHCEIPNEPKEFEMKVTVVQDETKDDITVNEVSAATWKNDANYLKGEARDGAFFVENRPPECICEPLAKNNDKLPVDDGTCVKYKNGTDNSLDSSKCCEAEEKRNCRKAPKVPVKTFRKFRSFANEQNQYNASEHIESPSVTLNKKEDVFKNVQFCGNNIKVEQANTSKLNGKAFTHDTQTERVDIVHDKDTVHVNDKNEDIKDNVSRDTENKQNLINITEGKFESNWQHTEMDNQNDKINQCKVPNKPIEQESVLENERDRVSSNVATGLDPEVNSREDQTPDETNKNVSYTNVQENVLQHNGQTDQISHIPNDPVAQPDFKATEIKGTFGKSVKYLKPQKTDDTITPSHGKDAVDKEHGCITKSSTKGKPGLYSTHSIANKYLSAINSHDSESHLTKNGSVTPKIKESYSEKPKLTDTNMESTVLLQSETLGNGQRLVNMLENKMAENFNEPHQSCQREGMDEQEPDKTDKDTKFNNTSETITYVDETDQISAHRPNKGGSIDSKNNTRRFHSPKLSPKTKVNQWLKQTHTETNSDEGQQDMYASQTIPNDISQYLNDLHKETPSYTKSVVALLEQNINCVGKASSDQQALEDGYEVTKKYSECNKTIDYANDSNNSPRCGREAKEQNIMTDEQDSNGGSFWNLVGKYKVPIGVSIAAACATVLICKKKL